MGTRKETIARIEELAAPVCADEGCELFLVEFVGSGRHSIVRVYIDREGGVNVEDCRRVSEALSVLLDVEDLIAHAYHLEVSSPGLDRPLRGPADFERYIGKKVKVVTKHAVAGKGQTTFIGRLLSYEDDHAVIGMDNGPVRIPRNEIKRANIEFEIGNEP